MNTSIRSRLMCSRLGGFILCGCILALAACVQIEEKEPKYHVIMQHELHAGMHNMAEHLNKIASISFDDSMSEQDKTNKVLGELDQIKVLAIDISSPGEITNYSLINRYMDSFIYDVLVAEQFSSRKPPNHFPAYRLVNSCLSCHRSI